MSTCSDAAKFCSADGAVIFAVSATTNGVHVERVQRRGRHARVGLSVGFDNENAFHQWCGSDPMRFEYPLVYCEVRRAVGDLFRQLGQPVPSA